MCVPISHLLRWGCKGLSFLSLVSENIKMLLKKEASCIDCQLHKDALDFMGHSTTNQLGSHLVHNPN